MYFVGVLMKMVPFDFIYNSFVQDTEARIMKLDEIKEELDQLNQNDLEAIILFVKDKMIANKYINVLLDALESRYSHFVCPFCGGTHIIRSGHYPNGLQKYRCYECDRAFNIYKNTFLECSKNDLITWIKYFIAMDEGKSLRECADYADVCLKTSFYMRHRIMHAMENTVKDMQLSGITEIDEKEMNISFSGNHKIHDKNSVLPRRPYERGRKNSKHRIKADFHDRIMVCTAADRNNHIFISVCKVGTTSLGVKDVINMYEPHLQDATCICSDGYTSYRKLAEKLKIELHAFKIQSKEKRGIYHINHVNYVHKVISDYFYVHHGISSKYLNEYFALIAYRCMNKLTDIETGLREITRCNCNIRWKDYVHKPLSIIMNK